MTIFIFPMTDESNDSEPQESPEEKSIRLRRERLKELKDDVFDRAFEASVSQAEEDWYRKSTTRQKSKTIAVRMPRSLLERLDATAADAATGRSHLIRQMVADYLNSMDVTGIRFSGCLLSVDKVDPTKH